MAEDSWDADDFDVEQGFAGDGEDQWKGEDEDLDLAAVIEPEPAPKPADDKPTKTKEERIAEKKAQRRAELVAAAAKEEELSAAEDKKRKEKLQRESDMAVAMETFGISKVGGIEGMEPSSEEEFNTFRDALSNKISKYEMSPHYIKFLEQLLIKCCGSFDVEDLRHLSTVLSTMAIEKQKAKSTKTSKKKGVKASLGAKAVGKASKKLGDYDYDNDLGAEFDDYM